MAQFTKRLSAGGNQYDLILDVNQSSQSVANNTSTVSWSLWIRKNSGSGYYANDTKSWSVNIGGQTKSGTIAGYNFSGKSSISLGSGSFTIAHNSDGAKSISASGTFTDSGVTGIGSGTASGSLTLTTIPRASSFGTISGSTLGSGITVNINRATSSFTHSMWYSFGTATWQVIGSGIGTSKTFTPPLTLGSQIPSTSSGTMTLILRTLNGSTQIGSDVTKTINVSIPGSVVPSAGTLSAAQGNSNNAGTYVQGFSSVKLTASGYAGSYGSTVKSVQITGAGHTFNANTGTTGVLNNTGNVQFTSTITDSRGRKSYAYVTVNFLPYSPPKIVSASVQRTNASGVATWNGTYMKYTYHVKVASLIVGGVQKNNVKTVYFDYGAAGTNWGSATHTTVIEASGNKTYGTISVTSSVPARINAYDNMGRYATWTSQVSAGTVALDIGDSNIGVGKFHERGTIDAAGDIYQNSKRVIDYNSAPDGTNAVVDFNSYWKHGIITIPSSANANNSSNSPKTGAGVLITRTLNDYTNRSISTPWLQSWQTYQSLDGTISTRYMGTGSNGSPVWSAWKTELNTSHIADHVIETGSNSNGTYEKWHSGKLVQKYAVAVPAGASGAWGSMFIKYINGTSWTFPVAFVNNQTVVTGSPEDYSGIIQVDKISTTRATSVYVMRPASWATATTVNLMAEGRWK